MNNALLVRLAAGGRSLLRRIRKDRRGNVMMVLGFAMIPMTFGVGFGVDYTRAMKLKTRMDAAADAAALAGVNVAAMQQTDLTQVEAAARKMFDSQVKDLKGLTYVPSSTNPKIEITGDGGVNTGRTVKVTYVAKSNNVFSGILGAPTLPVEGSATANATRAPHIDFYLLMDTSPSMLLPTTQTGIDALIRATKTAEPKPNGCAFACHVRNPSGDGIYIRDSFADQRTGYDTWLDKGGNSCSLKDYGETTANKVLCTSGTKYDIANGTMKDTIWMDTTSGNRCPIKTYKTESNVLKVVCKDGDSNDNNDVKYVEANGRFVDTYWLVRNYNALYGVNPTISLRIDEERTAAQQLLPVANDTATRNQVTYRLQLFQFDFARGSETHPVREVTSSLQNVNTMQSYTVPDFYSTQHNWWSNSRPESNWYNNDQATEAHNALVRMNNVILPTAGSIAGDGSTTANPQKVLFIITDGVVDEAQGGNRWFLEWTDDVNLSDCQALKNRGIRIAILYTEYLPNALTGDGWSEGNVKPNLPRVEPALRRCASARADGSPLFYKVTTDESIPQALSNLFALTVKNARLTR